MNRTNEQHGFTLLETLITIVILAVTSLIALPTAGELLQQYRLGNSANEVAFEVGRARMQAVAQNLAVRMYVDADAQMICRQTAPSESGPWTPTSCTDSTDPVSLPEGVSVSGDLPVFGRNGVAANTVTLLVQNSAGEMSVRVGILGRVTVS